MSVRVPLTLARWDYDRTEPLRDGRIRPDGIDLTYLSLPAEETFFRMARYREFEAAEMSLSSSFSRRHSRGGAVRPDRRRGRARG
jgi:4,5-dihydroxyphthalate decarboxylase